MSTRTSRSEALLPSGSIESSAFPQVDRFHPTARQAPVSMDRRQICNLWQCREEIHRASALRADENRSIVPGAKATHAHTRQRVRQHRFNKPWTHLRGNTDAYRKSAAQHHARCKEGRFLFTRRKARARTKPQQRSKVHTRRTTCRSNVRWPRLDSPPSRSTGGLGSSPFRS